MTESLELAFLRRVTERKASQYTSVKEWSKNHAGSLYQARKHQWIKEIALSLGWDYQDRLPDGHWTYERCLEEAKKHANLGEWSRTSNASYRIARQSEWQRKIATELQWDFRVQHSPGYWTDEKLAEAAKPFDSLNQWAKGCPTSYRIALKNKVHIGIGENLGWVIQKQRSNSHWTFERCLEEAGRHPHTNAWKRASRGSFDKTKKEGWFDEIKEKAFVIKRKPNGYWTYSNILQEAKRHKTANIWKKKSAGSYDRAKKEGWFEEIWGLATQPQPRLGPNFVSASTRTSSSK